MVHLKTHIRELSLSYIYNTGYLSFWKIEGYKKNNNPTKFPKGKIK